MTKYLSSIHLLLLLSTAFLSSVTLNDNFLVPKWMGLYSLTLCTLFSFLFSSLKFPRFDRFSGSLLILLTTLSLIHFFNQKQPFYLPAFLDIITFVVLFLFFFNYFLKDPLSSGKWLLHLFVYISFPALVFSLITFIFSSDRFFQRSDYIFSFFGNANMAAQYFSLVFCCLLLIKPTEKNKLLYRSYFFLVLIYLIMLQCRSVLLAVILISFLHFVINSKASRNKIFCFLFLVPIPFVMMAYFSYKKFSFKENTLLGRIEIWSSTLEMIADKVFLGWGASSFEFSFMSYNRNSFDHEIFNTPHNEFLRIAVEYGLPFCLFLLFFIGSVLKKFFTSKIVTKNEKKFIVYFIVLFSIESFFQFPLMLSYSFLSITAVLAYVVCRSFTSVPLNKKILLGPLVALIFFFSSGIFLKIYSGYYQTHAQSYLESKNACEYYPLNWKACIQKGRIEMRQHEFKKAEETYHKLLQISPSHFPTLTALGELYYSTQNQDKLCSTLSKYKTQLKNGKSPIIQYYENACLKK